jgi:nucleoside-diphosphate-sugar epimerase
MGPPAALGSIDQLSATTEFIWTVFSGKDIPAPLTPAPAYVDVRDVARIVVFGIQNPDIAKNERYLLSRGVVFPQMAADVLQKNFPDSRDRIKAGESVTVGEGQSTIDGSKAVKVTGQDYYAVEQTIVDTAKALEKFL